METKGERIKKAALEMGADVVGIASVAQFYKYVPAGYRPDDLLKGAKSVVVTGNRRYTSGTWFTSNIDIIHRARSAMGSRNAVAWGIATLIEREYGHAAIPILPAMFDCGMNPVISLKVCAELAGLGTRSMAGGIILNKEHGLLGFVAVITALDLLPDGPLTKPICPDGVCVTMWQKKETTPCMQACSAISGKIENSRLKEVIYYRQLCATRALTTMNAAYLRLLPEILSEDDGERRKYLAIGQARGYIEDPPGRGIWGRCIECMRVCPVNRRAIKLKQGEGHE
jgi:epoxyqueuosine reductase QueG